MSILKDIFRRRSPRTVQATVTSAPAMTSTWGIDPWANDLLRSGVDAIARVAAKLLLTPTQVFRDGSTAPCDDELTRLLQVEPNGIMSSYDYLYLVTSQLYTQGNSFTYIQRDAPGHVTALWPLHYTSVDIRQDGSGHLFVAFTFKNGKSALLPYGSLIHLRRHFHDSDILGSDQSPLSSAVRLAESQNRGIEAAIRTSGTIRGLLTFNGSLAPEKRDELRRRFERDFLSEGSCGVVLTDSSATFEPMQSTPTTISASDQAETRQKIFSYLGISQSIVDSSFDDSVFSAFTESIIEGLSLQIGLEFTRKLYPGRADRRIDVSSSRISYLSPQTVVRIFEHGLPAGVLSLNEARAMLGLPPLAEDQRMQSLNFVDSSIASQYQLGRAGHQGVKSLGDES